MKLENLPSILAIEHRAYAFPWTDHIFLDCVNAGYAGWIVCHDHGNLVGYALMSVALDEAHVLNLCVDPDWQGRGIGRMLMQHLLSEARKARATVMLLEVRKTNTAALRLYRNLGFVRIGLRRGYYPSDSGREDAYVLAHEII